MRGEALHVGHPARPVERLSQAVDQMPVGHGEPVRRDLAGLTGIADRQRVLKNGLHAARRQGDHLRAELRGGRADRVRRLQGMPPLDA
jgi:hypothetical protein